MTLTKLRASVLAFLAACLVGSSIFFGMAPDDDFDDLEPDVPAGRTTEQISALTTNIDEVIETTAFYSAFTVLLLLLVFWAFAQRKIPWAIYSGMALIVLWWFAFLEQNLSGIFWTPLQFTLTTSIIAGFGLAALNAIIAAVFAISSRRIGSLRALHISVAVVFAAIGLATEFGLMSPSLTLSAICMAISFLQYFLPVDRIKSLFGRLRESRGMMIFALLPILWLGPLLSEIDEQFDIVFLNRILAGLLTTTFITVFLARAVMVLRDRDAALEQLVEDAQRETKLNQALLAAEKGFAEARDLARERSKRLAVASHDMRQPIMALRATMDATMSNDDTKAKTQMNAAFDYLDGLAGTFIAEGRDGEEDALPHAERLDTSAQVSSAVITDTLDRMFRKEAEAKGLTFEVKQTEGSVSADPLKLMRVLSNLVSNAVKHSASGFVRITGRKTGKSYVFEITNSAEIADTDTLFLPYEKGANSQGSGLGLSIVQDVTTQEGLTLDVDTSQAGQTTFAVGVPYEK